MAEHIDPSARYTDTHEWARKEDNLIVVGISDHAQCLLGDLVYVELPVVGKSVQKGAELGVVESVKAASDVYAPVSGKVVEVNSVLQSSPDLVNSSPYQEGWLCKIEPTDSHELNTLKSAADYEKHTAGH